MTRIFVFLRAPVRRLAVAAGVLGCLATVGVAIPATAAAKVTSLTNCQMISTPGKYRLDANVPTFGSQVSTCFDIKVSGVSLNLNGHTVSALNQFRPFVGIDVDMGAANANIVGPGTLAFWPVAGIALSGGEASVHGVTTTASKGIGPGHLGGYGIDIGSAGNHIQENVASDNNAGIIAANNAATGNHIQDNVATQNLFGILMEEGATGNKIQDNSAGGNGSVDLFDGNPNCDSNVWRGNTFDTGSAFPPSCIH